MRTLKTAILKNFLYHKQMFLAKLNLRAVLYEDNDPGIQVGLELYQFYNCFTCDLCKTFLM